MLNDYYSLGFFPTPVHSLKRLQRLYPDYHFYIKRDDMSGLATGGNKTRKLEYLIAQAMVHRCTAVITSGAAQSNHCRQTAAACAIAGMECHLVLSGKDHHRSNGNFLLNRMLGATIYWREDGHTPESVAGHLRKNGLKPYIIPVGGSNETGCLGYLRAMKELTEQQQDKGLHFDYIVTATSSGGTQAGMLLGKKYFHLPLDIIGINIDKKPIFDKPAKAHIFDIANRAAFEYHLKIQIEPQDIILVCDYDQAGYGVLTNAEKEAINLMAQHEGILLDPVYTGRAFTGLLDLLRRNHFRPGASILFWHTGGTSALFAYAEEFIRK